MKIRNSVIIAMMFLCGCQQSANNDSRVAHLPFYNDATFTPHWMPPSDKALKKFHQIPDFELINQEGDTITREDFEGKIYITDFFFTGCPGICPKMTANLSVVQDSFVNDNDVLLLSHSVTPQKDSVSILKRYAEDKGVISGKWHLVTGDRKEIYDLGRKQYFVEEDLGLEKSEAEFLHTENFILIDKNGFIRGIYNGLNTTSIHQLIADVKTLKKE